MTDVHRAHQDLIRARHDLATAEARVAACLEQLDAQLAASGWTRMPGITNEAPYVDSDVAA
jgi:hypothetical protein